MGGQAPATPAGLLDLLDRSGIAYRYFEHVPVFTVEQAEAARGSMPGTGSKNLFLYDESRPPRYLLLMTLGHKRIDIKALTALTGAHKKLHFAPEERLVELLGVERGGVTVMGLVNDRDHQVELWVDLDLWRHDQVHCHPLTNAATLVMAPAELARFFALTGHEPRFITAPALE